MLVSEPTLTRVIDEVKLNSGDFYLEKHAAIFTCVHDLYAASKPVDELSLTEALVQRNQIEEAGGKHYVSELAAKVPAAGNAKHYAEIVQQNSLLRRLLGAGQQIQGWVHERDGELQQAPFNPIGKAGPRRLTSTRSNRANRKFRLTESVRKVARSEAAPRSPQPRSSWTLARLSVPSAHHA